MSDSALYIRALMHEEEAAHWATPEELRQVACFPLEQRRREYLTWRAVVREVLGREVEIAYNALGAPYLPARTEHISVSHAGERVAVRISDRRVAVDIERTDRSFHRILHKYLTPDEQALSDDPLFPAVAWCAKEALYKWAGVRDLTFEQVRIRSYEGERLTAQIREGEPLELTVRHLEEGYVLVYL